MPLPKAAFQDDSIQINAGLHNDLRCIHQPALIPRLHAHSNSQAVPRQKLRLVCSHNQRQGDQRLHHRMPPFCTRQRTRHCMCHAPILNLLKSDTQIAGVREKGGHEGPPVKAFKYKPLPLTSTPPLCCQAHHYHRYKASFPPLTQQRAVAPKECKPIRATAGMC